MGWKLWALGVAALSMSGHIAPALAVEDVPAFLPGSTIGVPVGLLPPAGLYSAVTFAGFGFNGHAGSGAQTAAKIGIDPGAVSFLAVPGFNIFGASYAVGITQPYRAQSLETPTVRFGYFGVVNTIVNLSTFSWSLPNGLFVSVGSNLHLKDGSYKLGQAINTGRNYYTFEPKLGITYLNHGFNFTADLLFDNNLINPANNYLSGNLAILELTATKKIGKFEFGVASDLIDQFQDDKLNGVTVSAIPGGRGYGNRTEYASVGPIIGYDTGDFAIQVYEQSTVVARNLGGGTQIWTRFSIPLYRAAPARAPAVETAAQQ